MTIKTGRWWKFDIGHGTYAMLVPGGMMILHEDVPVSESVASSVALCMVPCAKTEAHRWLLEASREYATAMNEGSGK